MHSSRVEFCRLSRMVLLPLEGIGDRLLRDQTDVLSPLRQLCISWQVVLRSILIQFLQCVDKVQAQPTSEQSGEPRKSSVCPGLLGEFFPIRHHLRLNRL
jgi:hypothetical protein